MEEKEKNGVGETSNPGRKETNEREARKDAEGTRRELSFPDKIQALREKIQVPKSRYNDYGGFKYRSCQDIEAALKPLLREFGLYFRYSSSVILIGDRHYLKINADIYETGSKTFSGENIERYTSHIWMDSVKPKMDSAQTSGSYESYAKKRALEGLLLLDDAVDPDEARKPSGTKPAQAGGISQEQAKAYMAKCKESGGQPGYWLKRFKINRLSEMSLGQWKTAMEAMERAKKKINPHQ